MAKTQERQKRIRDYSKGKLTACFNPIVLDGRNPLV